MVMKFADWGGLRNYFDKKEKYEKKSREENILYLKLRRKIIVMNCIATGLKRIHVKGLIHRDLHTGNIVCFKSMICITDMGLCKPANYEELENSENNAYGVLPYVAPEVLRGEHYTQASDIYSFGIIMYEAISEMPPYYDINHDEVLAVEICKGLRPNFNIKVPQLIIELIKKCLDAKPSNRPNAKDLSRIFKELMIDFNRRKPELIKQIEEISNSLSDLPSINKMNTMHSGAIYTSRLLSFKNLPEPKNSDDYYEYFDNITSMKYSECLDCEVKD
ncbi:uncharacterized protein OCT59_011595 [Rhizophagus irregularis]|nr:hypothetical protein OCT59_011595 [Rhizophagus irregularis]